MYQEELGKTLLSSEKYLKEKREEPRGSILIWMMQTSREPTVT